MYFTFVTLKKLSVETLMEIASDNGVIFTHYESFESPTKLLMADNERNMLDALDDIIDKAGIITGLPEDKPFYITV
jgi:hypothetical protein